MTAVVKLRAGARLLPAAAFVLLGGCSSMSLYFHNQGYEDSTAALKKQVDTLDVDAAFKTLNDDAQDLAGKEDQAAITSVVAMRNFMVVGLIDPLDGDWLGDPTQGTSFTLNKAAGRLEQLEDIDLKTLRAAATRADETDYMNGARLFQQTELNAVTAARTLPYWRKNATDAQTLAKIDPLVPTDCKTAIAVANGQTHSELPTSVRDKFGTLAGFCADTTAPAAFVGKFVEPEQGTGAISQAAKNYSDAMATKDASEAEAVAVKAQVDDLMKTIAPDDVGGALDKLVAKLKDASALAQFAGLSEIDNFLKCGLIADLQSASKDLPQGDAVPAQAVGGAKGATTATTDSSKAEPAASDACSQQDSDKAVGGAAQNKAIASIVKLFVGVAADGAATDRLRRIDANILALADLRQRLSVAKTTVGYEDTRLLLSKGQFFALLDEYRLLILAKDATLKIPDDTFEDFAELRQAKEATTRREAAVALSSYVSAWNYGRIPAVLVDFRFRQARRKFDIDIASATAANYKGLIQPMADALAAYGAGGITPDTLAEVISNLGLVAGFVGS
jgi:hypothetical protein